MSPYRSSPTTIPPPRTPLLRLLSGLFFRGVWRALRRRRERGEARRRSRDLRSNEQYNEMMQAICREVARTGRPVVGQSFVDEDGNLSFTLEPVPDKERDLH